MQAMEPDDLELLDGETCYVRVSEAALVRTVLAEPTGERANPETLRHPGTDAPQSGQTEVTVDLGRGEFFVTDRRVVFRTAVDTFGWPMSAVSEARRFFRRPDTVQFTIAGEGSAIYRGRDAREVYATIRFFERVHVPKWFTSYDEARARHAAGETINVGPGLVALAGVILILVLMLRGLWTHFTGH